MKLQQAIEHLTSQGVNVSPGTITANAVYHGFVHDGRTYYIYQEAGCTMAVIGIPAISTERPISTTQDIDSAIGR